jgi:Holliday junction resolvase RusA-like endonuclease
MFRFVIIGDPLGKQRPQFARVGKFIRTFTPDQTVNWEDAAAWIMAAQWEGAPLNTPLKLTIRAVKNRTQALMAKKYADGRIWRPKKPDGDNVLKIAADAMIKAGVIRDDAIIVDWRVLCFYSGRDEGPCVEIEFAEIAGPPPSALAYMVRD